MKNKIKFLGLISVLIIFASFADAGTVFYDDFNDDSFNSSRWYMYNGGGNNVKEEKSMMYFDMDGGGESQSVRPNESYANNSNYFQFYLNYSEFGANEFFYFGFSNASSGALDVNTYGNSRQCYLRLQGGVAEYIPTNKYAFVKYNDSGMYYAHSDNYFWNNTGVSCDVQNWTSAFKRVPFFMTYSGAGAYNIYIDNFNLTYYEPDVALTINPSTPANNSHKNTLPQYINFTCSNNLNYLKWNGQAKFNGSNNPIFTANVSDVLSGKNYYNMSCDNYATFTAQNFVFDNTTPSISFNAPQSLKYYKNGTQANILLTDTYLQAYNYTIFNYSGSALYNNNSVNISSPFSILDILKFPDGNYTAEACAADSLQDSPVISVSTYKTEFSAFENFKYTTKENEVIRELFLKDKDGKSLILDDYNFYTSNIMDSENKHLKSNFYFDKMPDGSYIELYYTCAYGCSGFLKFENFNTPRLITNDWNYYLSFADIPKTWNVEIKEGKTGIVKIYPKDYNSLSEKDNFLDPIFAGLNKICSNITFFMDSTLPSMAWLNNTPTNNSIINTTAFYFNISYTELNPNFILLYLDGNLINSSLLTFSPYTRAETASEGEHTIFAVMNDSAGNIYNLSMRSFNISLPVSTTPANASDTQIFLTLTCHDNTYIEVIFMIFICIVLFIFYYIARLIAGIPIITALVCGGGVLYFLSLTACDVYFGVIGAVIFFLLGLEHILAN